MPESISAQTRLGHQLRQRRQGRRWTLADVAARMATSQPSRISELETGKANARIGTLDEVGRVLGLTLLYVPDEKLAAVLAVLGEQAAPPRPHLTVPSVYDEVLIPDPVDEDDAS